MRRFFRFSIRDLFWLTLVVAVGLAWLVRERQLAAELNQAREEARKWRGGAGALEDILTEEGWEVEWDVDLDEVTVSRKVNETFTAYYRDRHNYEPSAPCETNREFIEFPSTLRQ